MSVAAVLVPLTATSCGTSPAGTAPSISYDSSPPGSAAADPDAVHSAYLAQVKGTILVTSSGYPLYAFTADKHQAVTCTAGCATVWPPLTVPPGETPTAGPGIKANASHELRTPLAGLQTLLEVALADPDPNTDTLRSVCQEALALGEHQQRLIQALLTLATSERGVEQWEPFDLAQIAETVFAGRRHEAEREAIHIDTTLLAAPTTGDPKLVELLVANLIDNALRYNTTGGRIEVSTISAPGRATITVSNTGPTVAPEEIERLFRPFQRSGHERVSHADGHGFGLAIVQAIANAHHAKITARPRAEGGLDIGVTFDSSDR